MNASSNNPKPIIFLLGPTASGKTDIGIHLCQHVRCQLISVDSSLVYRGLDIGTAKPTADEQNAAPHKLINIREPWETYSAAEFCIDAKREIDLAIAQDKLPVLIGGTMLYFNALEHGLSELPAADEQIRAMLLMQANERGWKDMHRELVTIDPDAAARIHPNDPQRIQRALEVWHVSGKTLSYWHENEAQPALDNQLLKIGLFPADRKLLHQRIESRFDAMLSAGFLDEVRELMSLKQVHSALPSMRSVGYRQAWQYLEGTIDFDTFRAHSLAATRQLAKRQFTWMRGMRSLTLVDSLSESADSIVSIILKTVGAEN